MPEAKKPSFAYSRDPQALKQHGKPGVLTIMENQMEKKMENEMETGFYRGL